MPCALTTPVPLTTPPCSAFGDPDFKEPLHLVTATPDVIRERLLPGDEFVILASDGLVSRVFSNPAAQHVHVHTACCREAALQAGTRRPGEQSPLLRKVGLSAETLAA